MNDFIIEALSQGGYFQINKTMLREFGATHTLILSLLLDRFRMSGYSEFCYTGEDLSEDSTFNIKTIQKSLSFWKEAGILIVEKRGVPCKTFYSLDVENLISMLKEIYSKNGKTCLSKNGVTSNTKNNQTSNTKNGNSIYKESYSKKNILNNIDIDSCVCSANPHERVAPKENLDLEAKPKKQEYSQDFEKFWNIYKPKRVDKPQAYKEWLKAIKETDPSVILKGAENYINSLIAQPNFDARYILHPKRFLANKRYIDESEKIVPKKQQFGSDGYNYNLSDEEEYF